MFDKQDTISSERVSIDPQMKKEARSIDTAAAQQDIPLPTVVLHELDTTNFCSKQIVQDVLLVIGSGMLEIQCSDVTSIARRGEVVYLRRGMYLFAGSDDYQGLMLELDVQFLTRFMRQQADFLSGLVDVEDVPICSQVLVMRVDRFLAQAIVALNDIKMLGFSVHLLHLKFQEVLMLLLQEQQGAKLLNLLKQIGNRRTERLRIFMEDNFLNEWLLEDFAREFGASLTTFKELFEEIFKVSPRIWINERRLLYSHQLLITSEKSIIDIAFESGFSSQSYFSQAYKKRFGMSPTQARKNPDKILGAWILAS